MSFLTSPIAGALLAGGVRNHSISRLSTGLRVDKVTGLLRTFQSHEDTVSITTNVNLLTPDRSIGLSSLEESMFSNIQPS